jgi:hypothetical protein
MILATPEANSPVIEDHPLNPNPASNWQNFFKVSYLRYLSVSVLYMYIVLENACTYIYI